jgi:hypothetical protein
VKRSFDESSVSGLIGTAACDFKALGRRESQDDAPDVRTFTALAAAHRFRLASMIRFLPAELSFRFGRAAGAMAVDPDLSRIAAQRFRWASAILFLAAALIFLRWRVPLAEGAAELDPLRGRSARNS